MRLNGLGHGPLTWGVSLRVPLFGGLGVWGFGVLKENQKDSRSHFGGYPKKDIPI